MNESNQNFEELFELKFFDDTFVETVFTDFLNEIDKFVGLLRMRAELRKAGVKLFVVQNNKASSVESLYANRAGCNEILLEGL